MYRNNFQQAEQEAFENFQAASDFDPEIDSNMYDPEYFDKKSRAAQQIVKASFDLVFLNPTAQNITIEVFNALNSFLFKRRTDLAVATYSMIPQLTDEGLAAAGLGIVGFNQNGDLVATSTNNALPDFTLSYAQFSYRALLESTRMVPFRITSIRMTVTTDAQIDNEIVHFSRTFLGGKSENTISPRVSFNPTQFQGKILDIPTNFVIDGEKGLQYKINAGETVKWNVGIEQYQKVTVR